MKTKTARTAHSLSGRIFLPHNFFFLYTTSKAEAALAFAAMLRAAVLLSVLLGSVSSAWATTSLYHNRLTAGMNVEAYFEMNGVVGWIQFYQESPYSDVNIYVSLDGLGRYNEFYQWHIHEYPINLASVSSFACSQESVGGHYDPFDKVGEFPDNYTEQCAANPDDCEVGDLSGKLGLLSSELREQSFTDTRLSLYGPLSPIGRSVVIHRENGNRQICANIEYNGIRVKTLRYGFNGAFQGDIVFRRVEGKDVSTFAVTLFAGSDVNITTLNWSLRRGTCDNPGPIYGTIQTDPETPVWIEILCSRTNHRVCFLGDLTSKCGTLEVMGALDLVRGFCFDEQLALISLDEIKPLILTIEDQDENILDCAARDKIFPRVAEVREIRGKRIFLNLYFYQNDIHDRTYIRVHITGLDCMGGSLNVHTNPVPPDGNCSLVGPVYDRPGRFLSDGISSGEGPETADSSAIGDLSVKFGSIEGMKSIRDTFVSSFLPLFGPFSIIGRSVVLTMDDGSIWGCANITNVNSYTPRMVQSILGY